RGRAGRRHLLPQRAHLLRRCGAASGDRDVLRAALAGGLPLARALGVAAQRLDGVRAGAPARGSGLPKTPELDEVLDDGGALPARGRGGDRPCAAQRAGPGGARGPAALAGRAWRSLWDGVGAPRPECAAPRPAGGREAVEPGPPAAPRPARCALTTGDTRWA